MMIILKELIEERRLFELSKGIAWEEVKASCNIEGQIEGEGKDESMLYLVDYKGLYLSIAVKDELIDFFVIRCWKGKTKDIYIFDENIGKVSIDSLDAWLSYLKESPQTWSVSSSKTFDKAIYLHIAEKEIEVVFEFDKNEGNHYGFQYIQLNQALN